MNHVMCHYANIYTNGGLTLFYIETYNISTIYSTYCKRGVSGQTEKKGGANSTPPPKSLKRVIHKSQRLHTQSIFGMNW